MGPTVELLAKLNWLNFRDTFSKDYFGVNFKKNWHLKKTVVLSFCNKKC